MCLVARAGLCPDCRNLWGHLVFFHTVCTDPKPALVLVCRRLLEGALLTQCPYCQLCLCHAISSLECDLLHTGDVCSPSGLSTNPSICLPAATQAGSLGGKPGSSQTLLPGVKEPSRVGYGFIIQGSLQAGLSLRLVTWSSWPQVAPKRHISAAFLEAGLQKSLPQLAQQ